jgi:hypothetical protein
MLDLTRNVSTATLIRLVNRKLPTKYGNIVKTINIESVMSPDHSLFTVGCVYMIKKESSSSNRYINLGKFISLEEDEYDNENARVHVYTFSNAKLSANNIMVLYDDGNYNFYKDNKGIHKTIKSKSKRSFRSRHTIKSVR